RSRRSRADSVARHQRKCASIFQRAFFASPGCALSWPRTVRRKIFHSEHRQRERARLREQRVAPGRPALERNLAQSQRVNRSPSPPRSGGLELLGKQRKESAKRRPARAVRAGASESLGRGEVVLRVQGAKL